MTLELYHSAEYITEGIDKAWGRKINLSTSDRGRKIGEHILNFAFPQLSS